jgi:tight adherence protein C
VIALGGLLAALAGVCLVTACSAWVAPGPVVAALVRSGPAVSPARTTRRRRPTRRARNRERSALEAEIPQLLDLLAAGSTAGLSAELALRRAADALHGPLGGSLRTSFERVDVGARWREELRGLADASGSLDLRRAVAVLGRTETLGASLADATRELATSVRQRRRADMLERARTAPVKMLFPLVFLILPAFLLLTVVPVLLTTLRSIG